MPSDTLRILIADDEPLARDLVRRYVQGHAGLEVIGECRTGDELASGEVNRWRSSADASFVPLRPELVVEVAYDQMEGARLRHAARFVRWRPDREPKSCTYDQLEVPVHYDFADVLAGGSAEKSDG